MTRHLSPSFSWQVAACGTGPCDAELDTCLADGQREGSRWFQYDACFFGDAYGPCEDDLGACLDGGGDPDALRDAAAAWTPQAAW